MEISYWGFLKEDKDIIINKFNLLELVENYGTPLHIINKEILMEDIGNFQNTFLKYYPKFQLFYSYKTNWTPFILKIMNEMGIGAEVISPFELWLARKIGVNSRKIIYNGIIKPSEGLLDAIKDPIALINIDTLAEIPEIIKIAIEFSSKINVGIRICPPWGWNAQFGMSLENGEADFAVKQLLKYKQHIQLKALLIHAGTGARSSKIYLDEIKYLFKFAKSLKQNYGIVIDIIDLGGGMGVPTVQNMSKSEVILYRYFNKKFKLPDYNQFESLENFAKNISKEIHYQSDKTGLPVPKLHLEPGRALVSRAQFMVLKIYEIRNRGKRNILITDGGRYNNTFPLSFEKHYVFPLYVNHKNSNEKMDYTVVGRICSPGDWVFKIIELPKVEKGDYLLIMDAGAYFNSYSNNFSFPRPASIMVDKNKVTLIRKRENYSHIIAMDKF